MTLAEQVDTARQVAAEHGRPTHVRVGAAALVLRGPLLLMVQRKGSHGAGTWGLPGGWQEFGEPIGYTAVREVAEKTGLVVAGGAVVGVTDDWLPDEGVHATTWFIGARYVEGEPVVMEPDKAEAVRWVALDALDTLPLFGPLKHFLATNPTWRDKVPHLDDPEGLNVPNGGGPEPEPTPPGLGLRAQRVVACFESYMEPMQDDPERWPALMAALEALRDEVPA